MKGEIASIAGKQAENCGISQNGGQASIPVSASRAIITSSQCLHFWAFAELHRPLDKESADFLLLAESFATLFNNQHANYQTKDVERESNTCKY